MRLVKSRRCIPVALHEQYGSELVPIVRDPTASTYDSSVSVGARECLTSTIRRYDDAIDKLGNQLLGPLNRQLIRRESESQAPFKEVLTRLVPLRLIG